jgi:hypothetical protein
MICLCGNCLRALLAARQVADEAETAGEER